MRLQVKERLRGNGVAVLLLTLVAGGLVVYFLPVSFPIKTGVDRVAWETFYVLRSYYSRCWFSNESFLLSPFSHPLLTLAGFPFLAFVSGLTMWKGIALFNWSIIVLTSFLVFKVFTEEERVGNYGFLLILFMILLQPVVLIWVSAFQGFFLGGFLLLLAIYLWEVKERRRTAALVFSFLPLVRHEFAIFLIVPFVRALKKRDVWILFWLLVLPFSYYFIVPYLLWGDFTKMIFIHLIVREGSFNPVGIREYFSKLPHSVRPLEYYGPLFWVAISISWIYIFKEYERVKRFIPYYIVAYLLFMIAFISRTIYPVFLLSILLAGKYVLEVFQENRKRIVGFLVVVVGLQILWVIAFHWDREGGDSVYGFRNYRQGYKCVVDHIVRSNAYFLFPNRASFVVWEDKRCNLAKRLIVPQLRMGHRRANIVTLLLPNSEMLMDRKAEDFLKKNTVVTIVDRSLLQNSSFLRKVEIIAVTGDSLCVRVNSLRFCN